jgi:hypothetical protein
VAGLAAAPGSTVTIIAVVVVDATREVPDVLTAVLALFVGRAYVV